MIKSICQQIREKANKCKQPCPLLDLYAYKCDMLCIRSDSLTECRIFLKLIACIIPNKTESNKKNA